jgi:hypothetical protein
MNFQSVSTAEKLTESGSQPGGYGSDGQSPGPVLASALGFTDTQIGRMVSALDAAGIADTTTIIVSAKLAPTILARLHLDPKKLQAVVAENTATLPGL